MLLLNAFLCFFPPAEAFEGGGEVNYDRTEGDCKQLVAKTAALHSS